MAADTAKFDATTDLIECSLVVDDLTANINAENNRCPASQSKNENRNRTLLDGRKQDIEFPHQRDIARPDEWCATVSPKFTAATSSLDMPDSKRTDGF
ncbi:MAG: hypothetical protein ACI9KN_001298 [Gammaproteobacteria bacterium]|jgi:hypothetical protein